MMTGLFQDIRFGLRQLRKSLGFTAVAAFTLALGIGANTAIFSLVSGILLRPLPYRSPAELVSVTGTYPKGAFAAMREQVHTIEVATYARRSDVLFLVMKEGAKFSLAGIVIGLGGAFAFARVLATQLYGVSSKDSLTYAGVAALVAIVTLAACYIPARRAMQVDPLIALRND
jgi:hypothetical protein